MNPGLTPAVQQALQRRAGAPQLSQVSPQAPMQNTVPQPMNPSEMTATSNPPASTSAPSQKFEPQNQDDMIVMALIEHLKNNTKLKKQEMELSNPSPQAMGGGGYMEHKIPKLMSEGYPQKQAVAIAYSMKDKNQGGGGYTPYM